MNFINKCFRSVLYNNKSIIYDKHIKLCRNYYANAKEQTVKIMGTPINYVKAGNGPNTVLCFPGALGTIWSDFQPQIMNMNKEKFTVIAFDPPGYGQSRPPNRKFDENFYKHDAKIASEFMNTIGIRKYSLLGWSDGGISSIILAAENPTSVDKLIIWGANSFVLPEDIAAFESLRDINDWSPKMKEPLTKLYGEAGLQNMWNEWCDTMINIKRKGGNICMEHVARVSCPTLILHGAKDPLVTAEHPNYLNANIKNSSLHIFPNGSHNIHLRYAVEFNQLVQNFILGVS